MDCPSCHRPAPASASICPACDFILDDSFLEEVEGGERAEVGTDPAGAMPRASPPLDAPVRSRASSSRRNGQPGRLNDEPRPEARARDRAERSSEESDDLLRDLWGQLRALPAPTRLAVHATSLGLLALLLPWRTSVSDGTEVGLFSGGVPTALGLLAAATSLYVRLSSTETRYVFLRARRFALGCGVFVTLTALAQAFFATDLTRVSDALGSELALRSYPHLGTLLALFAGVLLVVASLRDEFDTP